MKRYEKYKTTGVDWIGEVPETWHISKMKYIAQYINGYAFKPADWTDVGLPIIRIQDLTGTNDHPNYFDGQIPKKYLIQNGDILISWAATLDSFVWNRGDAWLNQHIFKTIVNEKEVERNYFVWLSKVAMSNMNNENKHGIMMEHVTSDIFDNYCIPIPPLSEQKSIAAYLDARCGDIDKVVATQEKRIALLNEMKQSIITQAVTRGLNPDAKMKDSGVEWIGMVPEHWEVKKLKFVSNSISKGAGITKEQVVEDGDTQCVRYGEIYTKYNHSFDSCVSATNKDLHPVLQYFGYGDILFTCTGELVEEIGKSVVYLGHERCLAGGDILVVSHNQDPSFLNYALNSYAQIQKSEGRAKLKVVHISTYDISNLLLALPPIEEQKQIADEIDRRCSSIDKQIGAVTRQIELLREYKQSLITDVVTGKVKVC